MNPEEAKAVIECLIFASTHPLSLEQIVEITELDKATAETLIGQVRQDYDQAGRGIRIVEVGGGFSIVTRPEYAVYIEKLRKPEVSSPLSHAALETLAIVAYKQPITRAEIENIRGVRAESAIGTLIERGLIREVGRKDTVGRPILYGTTQDFLIEFGLNSLSDLPVLGEGE